MKTKELQQLSRLLKQFREENYPAKPVLFQEKILCEELLQESKRKEFILIHFLVLEKLNEQVLQEYEEKGAEK